MREAAARLVRYRLALMAGQRRWALTMFVALTGVAAVLALTTKRLWWVAAGIFSAWIGAIVVQPGRMAARLKQLEAGSSDAVGS